MKFKQLPSGPYNPEDHEISTLRLWLTKKHYKPETAAKVFKEQGRETTEKFSLINPPPNAYARPHIGNVSGYSYQDVFARRARMQGKVTVMIPGKDHAAQQAEVVYVRDVLTPKGKKKSDYTREKFYNEAYKYFTSIAEIAQADEKRIGLSADFDRDLFTLDPRVQATVMDTFAKLWEKKMVYKGVRIVNWSPGLNSAVADIDTERHTVRSTMYYIKYATDKGHKEVLDLRDKVKKGKVKLADLEGIKIWQEDDNNELDQTKSYAINGMVIPLKGKPQLIIAEKSEKLTAKIFHAANKELGSCFVRWFADDEGVDKKDLDHFYKRGFILGTVRPETKFGDTAFAVNPADERFKDLVGKHLKLESLNGEVNIKIISNPKVDMDFGTGMVKVTPAHSPVDYEMYLTHNAENPNDPIGYINVIEKDGKLNHMAGKAKGLHAEDDREKVAKMFTKAGYLVYIEETESNITICERTKTVIQPLMSSQWFIDTDKLKQPAIKAVSSGEIQIHPDYMTKKLLFWLEHLRDWPISRSIWWGYRIPVWYKGQVSESTDAKGQIVVEIAGERVSDMADAIKKGLMRLDLQPGFAPILVPGRMAPENSSLYADIKKQYPWAQIVDTGGKDQEYSDYEKGFALTNFSDDSVVVAHSLGAPAVINCLITNKQKIKTLVLLAPSNPASKSFKDYQKKGFWQKLNEIDKLKRLVGNLVLLYSDDDEHYTEADFQKFAELIGAQLVSEKGKKHFLTTKYRHDSQELAKILASEAETFTAKEELRNKALQAEGWVQDQDVFDTWFSSGQWPYATLRAEGMMDFYPTSVMETGFDILELWVSRMIMLGLFTHGEVPFKNVYLHGLIKGEDGQKMSKSRGNLLFPDEIIKEYGADTLRMMYIVGNKAGAGYCINRNKLKGYRNFLNKIWNATRFVIMNLQENSESVNAMLLEQFKGLTSLEAKAGLPLISELTNVSKQNITRKLAEWEKKMNKPGDLEIISQMMLVSLRELVTKANNHMDNFRIGMAAEEIYQHFWHVFADIYIEQVKEHLYNKDREGNPINQDELGQARRARSLAVLLYCLQTYLKLLHPYIPFITETIWQHLPRETRESEYIIYSYWP